MGLSVDQIRRIAVLARLDLSPEEENVFGEQLAQVVEYIDQLEMFARFDDPSDSALAQPEAADEVATPKDTAWALDNAPRRLDRFLLVPQVKAQEGV
jgi:aspartyl-tRNA(Asn)/glutamyl-tRNA(Gln) amidotransferase subunit C